MNSESKIGMELLLELLNKLKASNEIHSFPSGAVMIDVFHNSHYIVFQFYDNVMGYSVIDENTGFDAIPDFQFNSASEFSKEAGILLTR